MIAVVAIALIDAQGRVLMQRRRAGRAHAGLWEFPGGKVEPGETERTALCREVEEELGLNLGQDNLAYLTEASDSESGIAIRLYTCRCWQGEAQCLDADALGWFDANSLCGLAMPPLDVPLAQAVSAILNQIK